IEEAPEHAGHRFCLASARNVLGMHLYQDNPNEAKTAHRIAIELCQHLVAQFPRERSYRGELARGHYFFGLACWSSNQLPEAEESFRRAITVYEQARETLNAGWYRLFLPALHLDLGEVSRAQGKTKEAEAAFLQAMALYEEYVVSFPYHVVYWERLFECYGRMLALLDQTHRPDQLGDPICWALKLYAKLGGALPQESALPAAVPRAASDLNGVLQILRAGLEKEQAYCRALEIAEKLRVSHANQTVHRYPTAYWRRSLGNLQSALGKHSEANSQFRLATRDYQELLRIDPKHVPALHDLARLLATCPERGCRDERRALELAQQAVELAPATRSVWVTLGAARCQLGDWKGAAEALEKSVRIDSSSPLLV